MNKYYIQKKLQEWLQEGIINQEIYSKLKEYEENQNRKSTSKRFWYILWIIASYNIGIGIISIIAANWQWIPNIAKFLLLLGFHFITMIMYLYTQKPKLKESLLFLFGFLFLAEIGITSQVYHLEGKLSHAFFFWGILMFFPLFLAKYRIYPFLVFGVLFFSSFFIFLDWLSSEDLIETFIHFRSTSIYFYYLLSFFIWFIIFIGLYIWQKQKSFLSISFIYFFIFYFSSLFFFHILWYMKGKFFVWNSYVIFSIILLTLIVIVIAWLYQDFFKANPNTLWVLFLTELIFLLNFLLMIWIKKHEPWDTIHIENLTERITGTIIFILLCLFTAYLSNVMNITQIFHLSVIFVLIRILIAYMEVFENLTFTGFGFIGFGILIFLLYWIYRKIIILPLKKEKVDDTR